MNWTVFGSQGVIGSRLVAHLNLIGHHVNTPSRDFDELLNSNLGHVIYAIGLTADFRHRPYDTVEAHVNLVAKILQRADFDSFLYLSSTRVYYRCDVAREDCLLPVFSEDPSDLYNISKLMGESICLQDDRKCIRVARLSNVVGGEDAESANFVPSLVRAARGGHIVLQTAMNSVKDYVHIDDVAELLPLIAAGGSERLYNVASGVQTTHAQWTEALAVQTGCTVDVLPSAPSVQFIPIDIGRIRSEFHFQPRPVLSALAGSFT